ncbi:class I SAM-dependent methyltransferase [Hominifimenecus microfluidus]|uniref:class I SAM-dependent DNA methyltransferase n=1 Tax=Hominifimenecus microfluidus TaxID=2885348 RepID=UPI0032C1E19A
MKKFSLGQYSQKATGGDDWQKKQKEQRKSMEAYTGFAEVYDQFMNNVPYERWAEYLRGLFLEYGVRNGLMLELGCGTGTMTEQMAEYGYDMIGVDSSEDMLAEAQEKRMESGHEILYLQQDMREFELYGTVAGVFSVCDSLNYLLEKEDLVTVFRLVNNYLDPKGIFIFDFNTAAEYRNPLRKAPIVETDEDDTMIWENFFDEESGINEHRVLFFLKGEDDRYDKVEEYHEQMAYSLADMKEALAEAGMEFVAAYAAETRTAPTETTPRIYVIARENGK